jgi:hypothetical protein
MQAELFDRSDNFIVGFPTQARALVFLRWMERRAPEALLDVRLFIYEEDGAPVVIYPREVL